jgi:hypothetical protein
LEDKGRATPNASEVGDRENINEEIIEFKVPDDTYSNDFYERKSTSDFLASMRIGAMDPRIEAHKPLLKENDVCDECPT